MHTFLENLWGHLVLLKRREASISRNKSLWISNKCCQNFVLIFFSLSLILNLLHYSWPHHSNSQPNSLLAWVIPRFLHNPHSWNVHFWTLKFGNCSETSNVQHFYLCIFRYMPLWAPIKPCYLHPHWFFLQMCHTSASLTFVRIKSS